MRKHAADFTDRLPADLYRDALDLALVFNQSLSEYLAAAVNAYVDAQLTRRIPVTAARLAALDSAADGAMPLYEETRANAEQVPRPTKPATPGGGRSIR